MRHVSKTCIGRKDYMEYLKATCRFSLKMAGAVKKDKDKRNVTVVHTKRYQKGYQGTSELFQTMDCTTERFRGRIKIYGMDDEV